jgi:hypothetical protein
LILLLPEDPMTTAEVLHSNILAELLCWCLEDGWRAKRILLCQTEKNGLFNRVCRPGNFCCFVKKTALEVEECGTAYV